MPVNIHLQGNLWCVYQGGEKAFVSQDYRKVEEWLDHAEIASKHRKLPAGAEPPSSPVGRLSSRIQLRNASTTSTKQ